MQKVPARQCPTCSLFYSGPDVYLKDDEMCSQCRETFLSIPHVRQTAELINKAMLVGAKAYLKFTCLHCGARQTIDKPNVMYPKGECEECKGISDFKSPSVNLGILFHAGTPVEAIDAIFGDE